MRFVFRGGFPIPKELRVNNQIRAREVRLIGENGEQFGIVPLPRALDMARSGNLDLVEVSPMAQPPVCKLLDYGKYKYEQTRKEREARKAQKTWTLKEMRLKPKIGDHDLEFKTRLIRNFLVDGDKVKVTVNFRGRENAHPEIGRAVLEEVSKRLADVGSVERMPLLEGRAMTMIMTPTPQKTAPRPRPDGASEAPRPAQGAAAAPEAVPAGARPQASPAPAVPASGASAPAGRPQPATPQQRPPGPPPRGR